MRGLSFCTFYTWLDAAGGSEHLLMYRVSRHAEGDEIAVHVSEKGGRSTHVEVSINGNAERFKTCTVPVPLNVEFVAGAVGWIWFAVCDCRVTSRNGGQEFPGFLGKDMFVRVACGVDPPHLPGRFCAPGGECMQHGKNRGDANSSAQENNRCPTRSQHEFATRGADLEFVADVR